MDLVVNHSSDDDWFKKSEAPDNPYRDYYHWWPAEKGKPPYRWSWFDVNSDAWKYDPTTDAYYLHYFSEKQPDLNWENPNLRNEVYDIMRFGLTKESMVLEWMLFNLFQRQQLSELPKEIINKPVEIIKYYGNGPRLHDYIQEMNMEVLSKYDMMTVARRSRTFSYWRQ
jgi:oligo-1,6-glucosidase